MKTLTIGGTVLELISFNKIRDKVVGVYAEIKIPTTAISRDELNVLFNNNQYDLIVTEEDGTTTTYSGYNKWDETKEKAGFYTVIQICESEAIHLLNEARKQIETLEREKIDLQNDIEAQGKTLAECATVINTQGEIITEQAKQIKEQTEQVTSLEEMSMAQLSAIDSILTEVVPTIIELAVAQAVEAVTTTDNQEETTDKESEVIEE